MFCSERAPHKQAYGNDFISMNQATTSDRLQTTKNTVIMKTIELFVFQFGLLYYYRAIRTRTVDLLGKRDRTDSYQNDSNSFKDPTCIFFLHWALSLTARNIS